MSEGYWVYSEVDGVEELCDEFDSHKAAVEHAKKVNEEHKVKTIVKNVGFDRTHCIDPKTEEDYGELYINWTEDMEVFKNELE